MKMKPMKNYRTIVNNNKSNNTNKSNNKKEVTS